MLGLEVLFVNDANPLVGARTMAFATLILAELFRAYSARSERISVFSLGLFSNKSMNMAVGFSTLLLLLVIYVPGVNRIFDNIALPAIAWIPILVLALLPFAASEINKALKTRKRNRAENA